MRASIITPWLFLLVACGNSTTVASTSEELRAALMGAPPGTVIELTAGTFLGPFDVPAGVTLVGAGVRLTQVVAPTEIDALRVTGGTTVTHLRSLSVVADGAFAVRARDGRIELTDVDVSGPRGAGAGFENADEVILTRVSIRGPVTEANAMSVAPEPTPADTLTHGLVFVSVVSVIATDVQVAGTAQTGVLSVSSGLTWSGGGVEAALGEGALIVDGSATLTAMTIENLFRGARLLPAYGLAIIGDATVTSTDLSVMRSADIGVLQVGGVAEHTRPLVSDNASGGLWAQSAMRFEVRGGTVERNGLVGTLAADVNETVLDGVAVTDTALRTRVVGAGGIEIGDGVLLLRPTTATLTDLTLASSGRIGLLMDGGGGSLRGLTLSGIEINGSDTQFGAWVQNGDIDTGWDAELTRDAVTAANDATLSGEMDVVGVVAPTELPSVEGLRGMGLAGVVAPTE